MLRSTGSTPLLQQCGDCCHKQQLQHFDRLLTASVFGQRFWSAGAVAALTQDEQDQGQRFRLPPVLSGQV